MNEWPRQGVKGTNRRWKRTEPNERNEEVESGPFVGGDREEEDVSVHINSVTLRKYGVFILKERKKE